MGAIFNFLYNQESLLQVYGHNRLLNACQKFYETLSDINPVEMNEELERFVVIVKENKEDLKTANDFLSYIYRKHMLEVYPNLPIALRVLLTCPVSVAGAERSFSKMKLIKTFHRSTMMDERLTPLATISIESSCVRDLDLDRKLMCLQLKGFAEKHFETCIKYTLSSLCCRLMLRINCTEIFSLDESESVSSSTSDCWRLYTKYDAIYVRKCRIKLRT